MEKMMKSERGAVLVQVAISILMLVAFSTFVVDYGVMWVARAQAQNAADAGALSGAVARAYDDTANPPATTKPYNSARQSALANPVWPSQTTAITQPEVLFDCPPGVTGRCVHVNVYRNGELGSTPLPTFFGPLLGVQSQGTRATATARVAAANASNCVRPFALADKWTETAAPAAVYNHWVNGKESNPHDVYTPPSKTDAGTGYKWPADLGFYQTLVPGSTTDKTMGTGWSMLVDLPDGKGGYINGSSSLRDAISACNGATVTIGQYLPVENAGTGPIKQGIADVISHDSGARWDGSDKSVINTCAPGTCPGVGHADYSPRIINIVVFDVEDFQKRKEAQPPDLSPCPTGMQCAKVVNILGFFVDSFLSDGTVYGYLMSSPGEFLNGVPEINPGASFLNVIQLVR
jgi:Flp pilus assembly protein TadG